MREGQIQALCDAKKNLAKYLEDYERLSERGIWFVTPLDKKYPGSFIEEAYNDATASLYKVIVKRSDGWSATIILDKEGFIRQASETPAA